MELEKTLHQLVNDKDYANLSSLAMALYSGEWDTMSELDQYEWLESMK